MHPDELALEGLHDHLERVVARLPTGSALDLGTGRGGMASRLVAMGHSVDAVDIDESQYEAVGATFIHADLDDRSLLDRLDRSYDLVTAVEIIEHLRSPIDFLADIAALLAPGGSAVVTTPNVDNLPSRVKLLLKGTIRSMDRSGDPTHISPVFWDLFHEKWLPRAGLVEVAYDPYPPGGLDGSRAAFRPALRLVAPLLRPPLSGEIHVFTLRVPA